MTTILQAEKLTLFDLRDRFGLERSPTPIALAELPPISPGQRQRCERLRSQFNHYNGATVFRRWRKNGFGVASTVRPMARWLMEPIGNCCDWWVGVQTDRRRIHRINC